MEKGWRKDGEMMEKGCRKEGWRKGGGRMEDGGRMEEEWESMDG